MVLNPVLAQKVDGEDHPGNPKQKDVPCQFAKQDIVWVRLGRTLEIFGVDTSLLVLVVVCERHGCLPVGSDQRPQTFRLGPVGKSQQSSGAALSATHRRVSHQALTLFYRPCTTCKRHLVRASTNNTVNLKR